jgi:hypothetical protein
MPERRWTALLVAAVVSLGVVSTSCEARVGDDGGEIEVDPGDGGED